MLRHRRLGDRELVLDGGTDGASRHLAVGEQFENAAPHRIPQDVERVHIPQDKAVTYISQCYNFSLGPGWNECLDSLERFLARRVEQR